MALLSHTLQFPTDDNIDHHGDDNMENLIELDHDNGNITNFVSEYSSSSSIFPNIPTGDGFVVFY